MVSSHDRDVFVQRVWRQRVDERRPALRQYQQRVTHFPTESNEFAFLDGRAITELRLKERLVFLYLRQEVTKHFKRGFLRCRWLTHINSESQ